jgi:hypothetical protein
MQLFSIDKSTEEIDPAEDFYQTVQMPDDVKTILRTACNNCHSNETSYPWYANIEPVSWWIQGHINNGRGNLNFSKWQSYDASRKNRKIDECVEVLEQRRMPFSSYVMMHKEAQLSDEQYNRLIAFFESMR